MPNENGGIWVRFRLKVVSAPPGFGPAGAVAGGIAPKPSVRVTGTVSGTARPQFEGTPEFDNDDDGRFLVDRFVVNIEVAPTPPQQLQSTVVQKVRDGLSLTVIGAAADLATQVEAVLRARPGPSLPGQPPGLDTGALADSIETVLDDDDMGAAVGSDLDYARSLECGTRRMPARPFLFPTFESFKDTLEAKVREKAELMFNVATGHPGPTDRLGNPVLTGNPVTDAIIIWNLYLFGKVPPIPPSELGVDAETQRAFDDIQKILDDASSSSSDFDEKTREALRRIDEVMRDPANSPAGPPDPPSPPPPLNPPVVIPPPPRRTKEVLALLRILKMLVTRTP